LCVDEWHGHRIILTADERRGEGAPTCSRLWIAAKIRAPSQKPITNRRSYICSHGAIKSQNTYAEKLTVMFSAESVAWQWNKICPAPKTRREIGGSCDLDTGLAAVAPKRRFGATRRRKSPVNPQIGKSALQKRGFHWSDAPVFMRSTKSRME